MSVWHPKKWLRICLEFLLSSLFRCPSVVHNCDILPFLHCMTFETIQTIYFLKAYHMVMSLTNTKTNTKTQTQTQTHTMCFKESMYAIFSERKGLKHFTKCFKDSMYILRKQGVQGYQIWPLNQKFPQRNRQRQRMYLQHPTYATFFKSRGFKYMKYSIPTKKNHQYPAQNFPQMSFFSLGSNDEFAQF